MKRPLPGERKDIRRIVLLDYDGTLVNLKKRPGDALLSQDRKTLLARLAETAIVGIVTGRSSREARKLVGLPSLAYIGNHGLEMRWGRQRWALPAAVKTRSRLRETLERIRNAVETMPGVLVEDKGLSAGIHYRMAHPSLLPRLRRIVLGEIRRSGGALKCTRGKKVFEIRPNTDWDKGRGIQEFLDRRGLPRDDYVVFIGDDRTDEDAFRRLDPTAVTVRVGRGKKTAARFRLKGVAEVWAFLEVLARNDGRESSFFAIEAPRR